jgi:hypothetical protein
MHAQGYNALQDAAHLQLHRSIFVAYKSSYGRLKERCLRRDIRLPNYWACKQVTLRKDTKGEVVQVSRRSLCKPARGLYTTSTTACAASSFCIFAWRGPYTAARTQLPSCVQRAEPSALSRTPRSHTNVLQPL